MHKLFSYVVMAASMAVPSEVLGQSLLDQVNFKTGSLGGMHLYGASVYSGYSTSAYPLAGTIGTVPGSAIESALVT